MSSLKFQALIGTAKTHELRELGAEVDVVSSPHRYCQNARVRPDERVDDAVSSPHRYCQNTACQPSTGGGHKGFQALIGTAKTSLPIIVPVWSAVFQALIGTAKTLPEPK